MSAFLGACVGLWLCDRRQPVQRVGPPPGWKRSPSRHPCPPIDADIVAQLLEARRSIFPKDYVASAVVDDSVVHRLLDAARWAPSHGQLEPWRFVVFSGEGRRALLEGTLAFYREREPSFWATAWRGEYAAFADFEAHFRRACDAKWLRCSHLVSILLHRQRHEPGKRRYPEREEVAAVACAVQNMHIMATALQLAAYWSSWYDHFAESSEGAAFHGLDALRGDRWLGVFCIGAGDAQKMGSYRATRRPISELASWRRAAD